METQKREVLSAFIQKCFQNAFFRETQSSVSLRCLKPCKVPHLVMVRASPAAEAAARPNQTGIDLLETLDALDVPSETSVTYSSASERSPTRPVHSHWRAFMSERENARVLPSEYEFPGPPDGCA